MKRECTLTIAMNPVLVSSIRLLTTSSLVGGSLRCTTTLQGWLVSPTNGKVGGIDAPLRIELGVRGRAARSVDCESSGCERGESEPGKERFGEAAAEEGAERGAKTSEREVGRVVEVGVAT